MRTYKKHILFFIYTLLCTSAISSFADDTSLELIQDKGPFIFKRKDMWSSVRTTTTDPTTGQNSYTYETKLRKNSLAGRYIYLGDMPRFEAENLELYESKMSLTLRVKAWVTQDMYDHYASILYARFKKIKTAFDYDKLKLDPLVSIEALKTSEKSNNLKAWYDVAAQYSKHSLENATVDIYNNTLSATDYKQAILSAYLLYLFQDSALDLTQLNTLEEKLNDEEKEKLLSHKLFESHLGYAFTVDTTKNENTLGYLTIVYPTAAAKDGPMFDPQEGLVKFGIQSGQSNARIWSYLWDDEFGGFPFMLLSYQTGEVAFHGPISVNEKATTWFLKRDYVSHNCLRMDSSDVIELRALLPQDLEKLVDKGRGIPLQIMNWYDVVNYDDGPKITDVAYYAIPDAITVAKDTTPEAAAEKWLMPNAQLRFWKNHFSKFAGYKTHPDYSYDEATLTLKNIPKYKVANGKLKVEGSYPSAGIQTFPYRGTRIIQYYEDGCTPSGFEDRSCKYPPAYFYGTN